MIKTTNWYGKLCEFLLLGCLFAASAHAQPESPQLQLVTEMLPPFQYINKDKESDGPTYLMVNEILKDAELDVEVEFLPWPRAIKTARHKPNILIFSIARTESRENEFNWIGPLLFVEPAVLIYSKNSVPAPPETMEELKQTKVCAGGNTPFYSLFKNAGLTPGKNLFEYQNQIMKALGSESIRVFDKNCDFRATGWLEFLSFAKAAGLENPEEHYGHYLPPKEIPGKPLYLYLGASTVFDENTLKSINESYKRLLDSGKLYDICISKPSMTEVLCSLVRPSDEPTTVTTQ